jgi:hypothetical protein
MREREVLPEADLRGPLPLHDPSLSSAVPSTFTGPFATSQGEDGPPFDRLQWSPWADHALGSSYPLAHAPSLDRAAVVA